MIALEMTRALGRQTLASAALPKDVRTVCDAALARPGRLLSTHPIASQLFLGWSQALLPTAVASIPAAVACEYILTACDLIDEHTDRFVAGHGRERSSVSEHLGCLSAEMSLTYLAYGLMREVKAPPDRVLVAVSVVSKVVRRALAAHHRDCLLRLDPAARPEDALTILRWRSGELIALPCVCAALLTGGDARVVALARRFGRALGSAGQLEDDLADRADDANNGRKTLPLLLAEMGAGDEKLAEVAVGVLAHRFLEEAATALRTLPHLVHQSPSESEALWMFLPEDLRA